MSTDAEDRIEDLMSGDEYDGLGELIRLGEKATPRLVAILLKHSDALMRKRSAIALGGIRDRAAVEPLVSSLSDEDPTVVMSAVDALASMGEKAVSQSITPLLSNIDPSIRKHAIRALAELGTSESLPDLEALSERDEHEFIRREATEALRRLRGS